MVYVTAHPGHPDTTFLSGFALKIDEFGDIFGNDYEYLEDFEMELSEADSGDSTSAEAIPDLPSQGPPPPDPNVDGDPLSQSSHVSNVETSETLVIDWVGNEEGSVHDVRDRSKSPCKPGGRMPAQVQRRTSEPMANRMGLSELAYKHLRRIGAPT